jgi:uncharacterized membrane protein (UPF0136 family)
MTGQTTRAPRLGALVTGALLVVAGVLWLIDAASGIDVSWAVLLPCALIVVGAAALYGSRTGSHGGLVTLGVFLTICVVLASAVDVLIDVPLTGGIGEETYRPTEAAATEYHWAIGKMTVDLTRAAATTDPIEVTLAIGELVVIVPAGVPVDITADAGVGEVAVLGTVNDGINPEVTKEDPAAALHLVVRVGLGRVEVRLG